MIKKIIILLILLISITFIGFTQDIHFSQYYASPLSLSPSNTGNYDGDYRFMSNYKTQWKEISKPYTTNSIGFDKQFFLYNEKFSGGLLVINDKSGGTLKVLKVQLSCAYHKRINQNEFHAGIQLGYTSKQITPPDETYPDQLNWETGLFDNTLPNYETTLTNKLHYYDWNMGLGWNYLKLKKIEPFVSLAVFHLNSPNESFDQEKFILKPRLLFSGGTKWFCSDNWTIIPRLAYMNTTNANEFLCGVNANYKINNGDAKSGPTCLFAGTHYRKGVENLSDADIVVVGMIYKRIEFGVSYDINISELHVATYYKGSMEFSLIYTGLNTHITKKVIPCDRY